MNEDYHYEIPEANEEELAPMLGVKELDKELEQIRHDPVLVQQWKDHVELHKEAFVARQEARQEAISNPTYEVKQDNFVNISTGAGIALDSLLLGDPTLAIHFLKDIRDGWSLEKFTASREEEE